jgi:putative Mg2+ transporter-C (MgtC) family protein
MDTATIVQRLALALVVGVVLGIDRDLRHKPAGVRTHSLVAIGSAAMVMAGYAVASSGNDAASVTRVLQGLITGIGFIGAGVIIHHEADQRVQGLTTAASIWVAAALGAAAGVGLVELTLIALAFALAVLLVGGPLERAIEKLFHQPKKGE